MALRLSLKPQEKIFIGGAVVQNGDAPAELNILSDVPLLREKDVLTEAEADTPCRRIYLCVQLMYMDPAHLHAYQKQYRTMIDEVMAAAPSTLPLFAAIRNDLACGNYYLALKSARKLIEYEQELMRHAQQSAE